MNITKEVLCKTFVDCALFCGREDVIQSIIYHQLIEFGLRPENISREQKLSSPHIDIVAYAEKNGSHSHDSSDNPILAIEIKGGAYMNRNALAVEIDHDGYCDDIGRLSIEQKNGAECWFICVDIPELGISVNHQLMKKVSEQCRRRKIHFAFYRQGEDIFHISTKRVALRPITIDIPRSPTITCNTQSEFSCRSPLLKYFSDLLVKISGHEKNFCSLLYHALRNSGFGANQISMETYFLFTRKGRSSYDIPDLVIFDKTYDGKFNLFKGGKTNQPNDLHKSRHIEAFLEIKGSTTLWGYTENKRISLYINDLKKLSRIREKFNAKFKKNIPGYFLCIDHKGISEKSIRTLIEESNGNQIILFNKDDFKIIKS